MSTRLPKESFPSLSGPPYSFNPSHPSPGVKSAIEDRVGRLPNDQIRTTFRNHPYLRPRLPRLQDDPSNMSVQSLACNELCRRRRRRLAASSIISLTHPLSMAHPSPPQQMDTRELQSQRLVRLFEIPEFFRVVREGWGAAVRSEKHASISVSTQTQNEERDIMSGLSDNQSTADNQSESIVSTVSM